jgi:hypothetical protein
MQRIVIYDVILKRKENNNANKKLNIVDLILETSFDTN